MDMVVHCGKSTVGSYVHSLVLTDIASGWTEAIAMVVREQTLVTESVSAVRTKLPFTVRGLDVDNDSAFINLKTAVRSGVSQSACASENLAPEETAERGAQNKLPS